MFAIGTSLKKARRSRTESSAPCRCYQHRHGANQFACHRRQTWLSQKLPPLFSSLNSSGGKTCPPLTENTSRKFAWRSINALTACANCASVRSAGFVLVGTGVICATSCIAAALVDGARKTAAGVVLSVISAGSTTEASHARQNNERVSALRPVDQMPEMPAWQRSLVPR